MSGDWDGYGQENYGQSLTERLAGGLVAVLLTVALGFGFMALAGSEGLAPLERREDIERDVVELVRSYLRVVEEDRMIDAFSQFMAPGTREVYTSEMLRAYEVVGSEILLSKKVEIEDIRVVHEVYEEGYVVVRAIYTIDSRYTTRTYSAKRAENYIVGNIANEGWKIVSIEDLCGVNPSLCR